MTRKNGYQYKEREIGRVSLVIVKKYDCVIASGAITSLRQLVHGIELD